MEKLDLAKRYKSYYTAKTTPELKIIEAAQYLSIPGQGDPSEKLYLEHIQALYATAYGIKFNYKASGQDFVVAKLEGLWDYDEEKFKGLTMEEASVKVPRSEWRYRLLIRMPDYVEKDITDKVREQVIIKKQLVPAEKITLYKMGERKVLQMLHIGAFSDEIITLRKMNEFILANNLLKDGLHNEVYLSDFNKTPSHKLRTILREPVK